MSIADIKAWMADHVFLTIGIAVALTFVLIWVSSEVLRRFHLRLLQTAAFTAVACGLWVVSMGLSNVWLMLAGAAAAAGGGLAFYAGTRLDAITSAEIAKLNSELGKAKTATPLHFVIDPAQAKAAGQK
ncbi:MAG: hypothetical protein SH859_15040 [Hyphomicrobium aestuarii]|nr:hypothetical protein [Hyphomicrobium aestuarii]